MDLENNLVKFTCRICLEEDEIDNLFSPCKCTGTSKYVHPKCLETWRHCNMENSEAMERCMECQYVYNIQLINSYYTKYYEFLEFILKNSAFIVSISIVINWLSISWSAGFDNPNLFRLGVYFFIISIYHVIYIWCVAIFPNEYFDISKKIYTILIYILFFSGFIYIDYQSNFNLFPIFFISELFIYINTFKHIIGPNKMNIIDKVLPYDG